MRQAETIGQLETEMNKHRLATMLKIRSLLTPEQRAELSELRDDFRGKRIRPLVEACQADVETLCAEADDRWSRVQCLREHREELSADCQGAIEAATKGHHGLRRGHGPSDARDFRFSRSAATSSGYSVTTKQDTRRWLRDSHSPMAVCRSGRGPTRSR
jgi:hypothetical protein